MKNAEINKLIIASFKRLGIKSISKAWILEMSNMLLVFDHQFSKWDKSFNINVGIWFKEIGDTYEKLSSKNCHLNHSLLNILMKLGYTHSEIKPLFIYEDINEETINRNISKLFELLSDKVIPYLKNFNSYDYMSIHFENDIALNPFFVLYHSIPSYLNFFKK